MDGETVDIVSPAGERRTVAAESTVLVPLMVQGWRQAPVQTSAEEAE